jgi:hypothetical protein
VPVKKKIKEKDYRRRFSPGPRRKCANVQPFGGITALPSYYDGLPMQAWGSGAAIPPPT